MAWVEIFNNFSIYDDVFEYDKIWNESSDRLIAVGYLKLRLLGKWDIAVRKLNT